MTALVFGTLSAPEHPIRLTIRVVDATNRDDRESSVPALESGKGDPLSYRQRVWWVSGAEWADRMWVTPEVTYTFVYLRNGLTYASQSDGTSAVEAFSSPSRSNSSWWKPNGRRRQRQPTAKERSASCFPFGLSLDPTVWVLTDDLVPPSGRSGGVGLRRVQDVDRDDGRDGVTAQNLLVGFHLASDVWVEFDEELGLIRFVAWRDGSRDLGYAAIEDVMEGEEAERDFPIRP